MSNVLGNPENIIWKKLHYLAREISHEIPEEIFAGILGGILKENTKKLEEILPGISQQISAEKEIILNTIFVSNIYASMPSVEEISYL